MRCNKMRFISREQYHIETSRRDRPVDRGHFSRSHRSSGALAPQDSPGPMFHSEKRSRHLREICRKSMVDTTVLVAGIIYVIDH